jgi:hypothetical protein
VVGINLQKISDLLQCKQFKQLEGLTHGSASPIHSHQFVYSFIVKHPAFGALTPEP